MPAPDDRPPQPPVDAPVAESLPEVSPDIVEQGHGDELDDIIPTDGYGKIPVVGLGGSAGGLQALQTFFAAMPPDTGMAFVVIMHLSPEHESILAQLLQRVSRMPVKQVQNRVKVEPNHVYVIPPAKHLSMSKGSLALTHSDRQSGRHVAVDLFFRILADTQGPHAAAIVLSGADGDGAIGIKRIKERGGLTIVQDPDEAEHDSMPRTAISTGMADWILPVAEMPAKLIEYWRAEQSTLMRAVMRQSTQAHANAVPITEPIHQPAGLPAPPSPATGGVAPARWSQLHYEFTERLAPPSILVNEGHQILHLSEHAGRYLGFPDGEASMSLLSLVHPALRTELRAALYRAVETGETVETHGVTVDLKGEPKALRLRVVPSRATDQKFLLVVFDELATTPALFTAPAGPPGETAEQVIQQLEQELDRTKWQLRQIIEQSEASNEELKAANEEFQAMNEELRSATEELETGREELQSVNEELNTVNQELKGKVDDLERVNSDLQNLMAATQIATVFLDRRLGILRYTPPAVALFNLIPTDVGRPLADLTTRLVYPGLAADAAQVLDDLKVTELEIAHADGRHFLTQLRPYRTTDDRISGVVLTFVDITARKHAENALRLSEEQLRSFIAVSSDTMYKMSADWTQMYQLEGKLFLADTRDPSRTWLETYIPHDEQPRVLATVQAAIQRKQIFELEHRIIRSDGTVGWILSRAIPLLNIRGEIDGWFGAAQDVTERRRAEEALRTSLAETESARTEAEAASRAKDQFLAVLSHELRTPLTPVTMAAHILSRRRDLPEGAREAVEMIQRNVLTETQMIDSLLDVTRVAHGKLEIVRAPLDLHEAVRRAVEISAGDLRGKKQRFTLALEAGEHTLEGDTARLQQVFWNLLKNASKFTPEGGSIRLATRNEPGQVAVEIADTGIGFEAEAVTRIFESFTQADAGITQQFGGLGLGLAISKATVDAHGGTLTAHSDGPGQGATFTVTLPLV